MVIDQKKLELLEKSLENPEKISIFKIFAKENSDSVLYFLELFIKTYNPILRTFLNSITSFDSKESEISFFQRLFHEIISHPTNETFELLELVKEYFKCFKKDSHLLNLLMELFNTFKDQKINNLEELVDYSFNMEMNDDLKMKLLEFLIHQLGNPFNSKSANECLMIFPSMVDDSKFKLFHSVYKKEILGNTVPLTTGLILWFNVFMDEIHDEIVTYMELWKPILQDENKMRILCSEISHFYEYGMRIVKKDQLTFEILSICISQLIDIQNDTNSEQKEQEEDCEEEEKDSEGEDDQNEEYQEEDFIFRDFDDKKDISAEYLPIFRSIMDYNPSFIDSILIPFINILLFNEGIENKSIGVNLLENLRLNDLNKGKEIFLKLIEDGLIKIFLEFLESREIDFQLKVNIFAYLDGNYHLMKENGLQNEIKLISKEMMTLIEMNPEDSTIWGYFHALLICSNEFKIKLGFKMEELLELINPSLKFSCEIENNFEILNEIFSGEEIENFEIVDETVCTLLEIIYQNTMNLQKSFSCLQTLFKNPKINTRDWFENTLSVTIDSLDGNEEFSFFEKNLGGALNLLLILIRRYGDEVEPFISKSHFFQILTKVNVMNSFSKQRWFCLFH
jgi:hypothetical protein